MGLQAAIAHVLVDDELRRELVANPERIQIQFSLSMEDMRLLSSCDVSALDRMSRGIRAKRLDFLKKGLPCTVRAISNRILAEFARTTIPRTQAEKQGRVLAEARRLLVYLRSLPEARVPAYLQDLGQFELILLELSLMSAVALPPLQWSDALCDESVVCLAKQVRICKFRFDVVALSESERIEKNPPVPRATAVLLKKEPVHGTVVTYRIGEAVYEALSVCAAPQRLSDLYSSIASIDMDAHSHRARLFETVRLALERGILARETA